MLHDVVTFSLAMRNSNLNLLATVLGSPMPTNVLGTELQPCCSNPMTGFYRDGYCRTGAFDDGVHVVCVQVTEEFLDYSQSVGNDLSTPMPEYDFPGLQPGDCWCLCASRWQQAFEDGMAPKVKLSATHSSAIEFMDLADLQAHAVEEELS